MVGARSYGEQMTQAGPVPPLRLVHTEVEDGVAILRMDDPGSRNAFSVRMTAELQHTLRSAAHDDSVGAIVLTGTGNCFSAGGDIRQMSENALPAAETHEFIRRQFGGVVHAIADTDKPVVAAVNGHAMGVGLFAALSCDMIVASRDAQLGTAYIKIGLAPLGISYILARVLGYARAYELCALGDPLSASEAHACGLVNRVTEPAAVHTEAYSIAHRLAHGPSRALGFTKQILRRVAYADLDEHLMLGEAIQPMCLAGADHQNALITLLHRTTGEPR